MKALGTCIWLWLLATPAAWALDSERSLTQLTHQSWQLEEGLPENSVLDMVQTPDGYLWLATYEGLTRFDGVRFKVFNRFNTPALTSRAVKAVELDAHGDLWVALRERVLRMRQGQLEEYTLPDGKSLPNVLKLIQTRDGALWFATMGEGYLRVQDGRVTRWTERNGLADNYAKTLVVDREGRVWFGTDSGLQRLEGDELVDVPLPGQRSSIDALVATRRGGVFAASRQGKLFHVDGGRITALDVGTKPDTLIRTILELEDGSLFLATQGEGLVRLAAGRRHTLRAHDGLHSDTLLSLLEGEAGGLWVGTEGGGLHRLSDGALNTFGKPEGLGHDMVSAVLRARDGSLWAATLGGGVSRIHQGKVSTWTTAEGLVHDMVLAIAEGPDGALWFGTQAGLSRWKDGVMESARREGTFTPAVRSLQVEADNTVWLGTERGLFRLSSFSHGALTMEPVKLPDGLGNPYFGMIVPRNAGGFWVGTSRGSLGVLQHGRLRLLAPSGAPMIGSVRAVLERGDDGLWIGTNDGLFHLRSGRFTRLGHEQGLADEAIFSMTLDPEGWLWTSGNRGVSRIQLSELERARDHGPPVRPITYGAGEGMRSPECNGLGQPAAQRGPDGRIWFPTIRGVAVYDPERDRGSTLLRPVLFEELKVDGQPVVPGPEVSLEPSDGNLEVRYTTARLTKSEKVRFRYRLVGFSDDWVEAGERRVAYFTKVPPGRYVLEVEAGEGHELHAPASARMTLQLTPRLHQRLAFKLALAVLLTLSVLSVVWWRLREHRSRERELEDKVRQRTAQLAAANQELDANLKALQSAKSQLVQAEKMAAVGTLAAGVGHEINNPLAFILANLRFVRDELRLLPSRAEATEAEQETLAEVETALDEASKGAERVRNIVKGLKTFSRTEKEELTAVDVRQALELSLKMASAEIRYRARLVEELDEVPRALGDATRLGQVFLNLLVNAAQAIPEGRADENEIRVVAREEAGRVRVDIHDTGAGIKPGVLPRIFEPFFTTKPVGVGTGLGLSICHAIIQSCGGEIRAQSTLGKGSCFTVWLRSTEDALPGPKLPPEPKTPPPRSRARVLVVDDEPLVAAAMVRSLEREHETMTMTSARTALGALRAGDHYDAILCDLMMPEMTGMELHAELAREAPALARRMLFITGGAFTESARSFLDHTSQPCLEKPFEPDRLRAAVRKVLEEERAAGPAASTGHPGVA